MWVNILVNFIREIIILSMLPNGLLKMQSLYVHIGTVSPLYLWAWICRLNQRRVKNSGETKERYVVTDVSYAVSPAVVLLVIIHCNNYLCGIDIVLGIASNLEMTERTWGVSKVICKYYIF